MPTEQHNPLYLLLLVIGTVFCVTALAYAVFPVWEQKAADAGQPLPPSPFREALRSDGWRWLLGELAVLLVVGIASMVVDRLRSLRQEAPPGDNDRTRRSPEETTRSSE
jgi:hypothetical protein